MDAETKELVARGREYADPSQYAKKETGNYVLVRELVAKVEEQDKRLRQLKDALAMQNATLSRYEEQTERARQRLKPYGYTDSVSLQWIEYDHIEEARRNLGGEL